MKYNWNLLLTIALFFFSGCNENDDKVFEEMKQQIGYRSNIVILSDKPVRIASGGGSYSSHAKMKIIGSESAVCFVLRGNTQSLDYASKIKFYHDAIADAHIDTVIVLTDGVRVPLNEPLMEWDLRGKILSKGELAACERVPSRPVLAVGTSIKEVEVSASHELIVKGIYWHSEKVPE